MTTWDKIKELMGLLDVRYFNSISTIRTSLGFTRSLFAGGNGKSANLDTVFNYHPINDHITTSGQPLAEHFPLIRAEGFSKVINLAPHGAENALANEAELVAAEGMTYIHIPVAFDNPTEQDFQRFCDELGNSPNTKVYVHCAANMRVSAFIYRYRTQILGEAPEQARADLDKLWKPFGVWADFIQA